VLCSDLYLPQSWANDPERRRVARIPDELTYRPKWRIAIEQVSEAIGNGVRFSYLTFDEDYGSVPGFWFELDALGQRGVGEVRPNFLCWATPPSCRSLRAEQAPREARNLVRHSPAFCKQSWTKVTIKQTTRGPMRWRYKAARVQLPNTAVGPKTPTDRRYWLIWAQNPTTGENKYFLSNTAESTKILDLLRVGFSRWHIEKWFERAKQRAGLGAFEMRNYTGLMRHWLCSQVAMLFLAEATHRSREKKSAEHAGAGRPLRRHAGREGLASDPPRMEPPAAVRPLLPTP